MADYSQLTVGLDDFGKLTPTVPGVKAPNPAIASLPSVPTKRTVPVAINPNKAVAANSLNNPPVTMPPASPSYNLDAFVASFDAVNKAAGEAVVSAEEARRKELEAQYKTESEKLKGKGTRLAEEESRLGVNTDTKSLQDLNLLIAQRTGEYQKAIIGEEGRAIPIEFITGRQDVMKRQQASEIGALEARRAALQGNIELSKQIAQRTVDLEFQPIEQEIKNLEVFMNLNSENLTREEKKQAEKLAYINEQQKTVIAEQKENRKVAIENGVTMPFYTTNGTVIRTSDGKSYPDEQSFLADGGKWNQVEKVNVLERQQALKRKNESSTTSSGSVDAYAQDVMDGVISLTSVPNNIQTQVSQRVREMSENQYDSETEARIDYDAQLRQLLANKASLTGTPSALVKEFVKAYGKFISKQEIEGTIRSLFQ